MTPSLEKLLCELEQFGRDTDDTVTDRGRRMLNVTRDTGAFLNVLVRASNARRVLEIGTSNGYSTLWLADAAGDIGGSVTTVEYSELKLQLAATNFERSGLAGFINQVRGDAGPFLSHCGPETFDLVFLDSERTEYPRWWREIRRVLRRGGVLVVDNATSHSEQIAPLIALVGADTSFRSCLVPVGNGEFLATRSQVPANA